MIWATWTWMIRWSNAHAGAAQRRCLRPRDEDAPARIGAIGIEGSVNPFV